MKPKRFLPKNPNMPQGADMCQTPPEAVRPLVFHLQRRTNVRRIWEPAEGEGLLSAELRRNGFFVWGTDLLRGYNFFEGRIDRDPEIVRTDDGTARDGLTQPFDAIVTNPPYSVKFHWLRRCYEIGKPFALLLPVETLGAKTAQKLFAMYGVSVLLLHGRINFKMPDKGWDGQAHFPVAWFLWQLGEHDKIWYTVPEVKRVSAG